MEERKLRRQMRPLDVWALAVGAIIGWGCFVLPGNTFLPKAGPLGMVIGMLIGAALILVVAFCYGYMLHRYPVSGGEFIYTKTFFGKGNAFICGWSMALAYWSLIPLNATALGLISRYLFPILQFGELYQVAGWSVYTGELLTAFFFLVLVALVNLWGIKKASWMQTFVALTLVGTVVLLAALALCKGVVNFENLRPAFPDGANKWKAIFSIVAMAPWAYIGFDCVPQAAEEYSFKPKKATFILIFSVIVAALLYITMNTITAVMMPWEELLAAKHNWPTGYVVATYLGKFGLVVLGIAMFCAVFSGMNGFYMATSRLLYAMAQENALPSAFSHLNKRGVPDVALVFILILSLIAPWFGREVLGWIVDMTSVGAAIVFAYTTAASAVLAYRNHHHGRMVLGILGCLISIFFLSLLVIPGMPGFLAKPSWYSLGAWTLLGIIFFLSIRKKYYGTKVD